MTVDSKRILRLLFTLLILLPVSVAVQAHVAHADQPAGERVVTIVAGRNGFNGSASFSFIAIEGETLTIHFVYGDGDLAADNPHRVTIDGYNVQTEIIGKPRPMSTVTIKLGQPGQFRFYCDLPCQGMMNMQNGTLIVLPSPTRSRESQLLVSSSDTELTEKETVLSARLMDKEAGAISGAIVNFYVKTTFGGWLKLASVATDELGVATARIPYGVSGSREVMVFFAGSGRFKSSNDTVVVSYLPKKVEDVGGLAFPPNFQMAGVSSAANVTVVGVVLAVVFSVWFVFGTALYRILLIKNPQLSSREPSKDIPTVTPIAPVKRLVFLVGAVSLLAGLADYMITSFLSLTGALWVVLTLAAIEALVFTGVVFRFLGKKDA